MRKLFSKSLTGSSFIRALIFNQHFKYIFKKFKLANNYLYLKENLSWEKSLLDNFNQYAHKKKNLWICACSGKILGFKIE